LASANPNVLFRLLRYAGPHGYEARDAKGSGVALLTAMASLAMLLSAVGTFALVANIVT
jgi:hypothetical protein